jgi:hypothetical protein
MLTSQAIVMPITDGRIPLIIMHLSPKPKRQSDKSGNYMQSFARQEEIYWHSLPIADSPVMAYAKASTIKKAIVRIAS